MVLKIFTLFLPEVDTEKLRALRLAMSTNVWSSKVENHLDLMRYKDVRAYVLGASAAQKPADS